MSEPVLLVENLFSTIQFPNHSVAANEAASGHEAFRVADGRRSSLDYWSSTTTNAAAYITSTFDRLRAFDTVALDRGHNLAGETIRIRVSSDDFSSYEEPIAITLPSAPGGDIDDPLGCVTEEGAWLKRLDARAGYAVRLYVDAMGTGLVPRVVGLWAGMSYAPGGLLLPFAPGAHELVGASAESDVGWQARGRTAQTRRGTFGVQLTSLYEQELVRYHLEGHYGAGRPMWVVTHDDQAERAFQVRVPKGAIIGLRQDRQNFYGIIEVPYEENQAVVS